MSAAQLLHGQIISESLLAPFAARVARFFEESLDYEALNPDSELAVEAGIWLSNAPLAMALQGIRISCKTAGTGTPVVQVYAGGIALCTASVSLTGETTLVPASGLVELRRSVAAGTRLTVSVLSAPGAYSGWAGLRVAFIFTPALTTPSAWGMLPPFALWGEELAVDPLVQSATPLGDSWGSGLCYWPSRGTLVMVNNSPAQILEMTTAGVVLRTCNLDSFGDVEAVCVVSDAEGAFAVATEAQEIIQFTLPPTAAWPSGIDPTDGGDQIDFNISTIATAIPAQSTLGFESLHYDTASELFYVVNQAADGDGAWDLWTVVNTQPDAEGYAETRLFDVRHAMAGLASYISDMAVTAHGTLVLVGRDATAEHSAIAEINLSDGRLLQASTLPGIRQCEGVALSPDNTRLYLVGEPASEDGAQLVVYRRP